MAFCKDRLVVRYPVTELLQLVSLVKQCPSFQGRVKPGREMVPP